MTQSASTPIRRSALGRAPATSASPPVLANGTISEEARRTFTALSRPSLGQLAHVFGRLLRRRRIDVEPRPPLEPRHLRELRHDLDVPVEEIRRALLERRAVDDEVERGVLQREVQAPQGPPEDGGQGLQLLRLDHLVGALVTLRHDPRLEREARGVRRVGDELAPLLDDALLLVHLLDDDVAEDATVAEAVIVPAPPHLLDHALGDDRK